MRIRPAHPDEGGRLREIAAELGSSREVVSRILENFASQGMLITGRGVIEVLDRAHQRVVGRYFSDQGFGRVVPASLGDALLQTEKPKEAAAALAR